MFDATTGEYVYAPATDFVGTDTFVVSVTDFDGSTQLNEVRQKNQIACSAEGSTPWPAAAAFSRFPRS